MKLVLGPSVIRFDGSRVVAGAVWRCACLLLACGGGRPPPVVAPVPEPEPAASAPEATASAEPSPPAEASAPPEAPAPPAPSAPPPKCIGGQIILGACICEDRKVPDETGQCVDSACPSQHGGATFRDPQTGQCMECRRGTKPTKDGHCE